jgi:hypothetical protein
MSLFRAVEQCHNDAGINQNRIQRPNPRRCRLWDPRSLIPEAKRPKRIIGLSRERRYRLPRALIPSRTTFESVHPSLCSSRFSIFAVFSSIRACTIRDMPVSCIFIPTLSQRLPPSKDAATFDMDGSNMKPPFPLAQLPRTEDSQLIALRSAGEQSSAALRNGVRPPALTATASVPG